MERPFLGQAEGMHWALVEIVVVHETLVERRHDEHSEPLEMMQQGGLWKAHLEPLEMAHGRLLGATHLRSLEMVKQKSLGVAHGSPLGATHLR